MTVTDIVYLAGTLVVALAGREGVAALVKAKASKRVGQAANEIDARKQQSADWSAFTAQLTSRVAALEGRVQTLEKENLVSGKHIDILQEQIWSGVGPPPRPRPDN